MQSDMAPFLKTQHSVKEIDFLVNDLYERRAEVGDLVYRQKCHDLLMERNEFEIRDNLLKKLDPYLLIDEKIASSSFGPLLDEYLELRQDQLLIWQPISISLVESVITIKRQLTCPVRVN